MIRYKIDKEKGIITAYFYNPESNKSGLSLLKDDLRKYGFNRAVYWPRSKYFELDLISSMSSAVNDFLQGYTEDAIRGIAKLSPNDTWDEEFGKEIAKKKLIKRERFVFRKFGQFIIKDINRLYDDINKRFDPRIIDK